MSFKPTLAVAADFTRIKYPVYASPKLDGIRCSIVDGKALTRTLKPIPNKRIYEKLSLLALSGLDGELIVGSATSSTCYAESSSNVMAFDKVPDFTFWAFDIHDVANPFSERLGMLRDRAGDDICIKVLDHVLLANEAAMIAYEEKCVRQGYEGIMLRSPAAPYKCGRSTVNEGFLLKVKRFEDSEAEIIGFEEEMANGNESAINELGRTSRSTAKAGLYGKGSLGSFLVRDVHTGIEFSIGTGINAAQRQFFWSNQTDYIGSLIKYKYFPVGVKVKPRHPVYLGMRDKMDM